MPWATNNGVRIYWEEEGSGQPLLLVMGLSFSLAMWGELRPFLARRFRTILFDNRSVGSSDTPLRPFTLRAMAEDAISVLDSASDRQAHVFGISMGGMIAQELTLQNPDRVVRLILGCTQAGGLRTVRAHHSALQVLASPFMSADSKLAQMIPYLYHPNTAAARVEADLARMRNHRPTMRGYMQQLAAIVTWSAWRRLPEITAPTLVLHGDSDLLVPPENARILASLIPHSRLVILPQAGHMFPTDQPELTREAIVDFLEASASAA